jgi:hypothetical protein
MSNILETRIEDLAQHISSCFQRWDDARGAKKKEWVELRDYLYATDTTKTGNAKLPWSNKTTLPKLTQIMENLVANYESTLFPNQDWLKWEAGDPTGVLASKKKLVTEYTKAKLRESGFRETLRGFLYDWVIYGNCFSTVEYVREEYEGEDGEITTGYVGGKAKRISPLDIVFNPTATSFDSTPKIVRYLKTMGDLALDAETRPELGYAKDVIQQAASERASFSTLGKRDQREKRKAFVMDGFGSLDDYYQSGLVELLEFQGDIYDPSTGAVLRNQVVTILDRKYVLRAESLGTWNNKSYIKHIGWRPRPDNLWAMSPLDNLVGMQYRIDHLENLKADIMDMVAYPIPILKGDVEWDGWYPGAEVYVGEDGAIDLLRVDSAALSYDNQINMLEMKMEQYAGAPREAMGIRSAGEKTAYEVQQLQNAAGRLFQSKAAYFEEMFLEPLVNQIFEVSRRNLDGADVVRLIDDELGITEFLSITQKDLATTGSFYPRGARHFAEKAMFVQEVTQFISTMPPDITAHISGKVIAQQFAEHMNLDKLGAFQPNVRILEQIEQASLQQTGQQQLAEEDVAAMESL